MLCFDESAFSISVSQPFSCHVKLNKTQACFLEAARLFRRSFAGASTPSTQHFVLAAGFMMIRRTTEDIVLTTDDAHIHGGRLPLTKGTTVVVDMVGMRM